MQLREVGEKADGIIGEVSKAIVGKDDVLRRVMIGSLAGFSIGIVAAAIVHAWFYERTESVFLNIFIHAIFNTLPLATTLLFQDSPAAVMANLALWAVVIYLKRRHEKSLEV